MRVVLSKKLSGKKTDNKTLNDNNIIITLLIDGREKKIRAPVVVAAGDDSRPSAMARPRIASGKKTMR